MSARAATVQASISAVASPPAGATVQIVCYAEGRNPSGMMGGETMRYVDVTVSDGTVSPARIDGPAVASTACSGGLTSCNVIQGSVSWATPPTPGALTATCTATYVGGFTGQTVATAAASTTITTVAAGPLPPVVSPVAGPTRLVVGSAAGFSVTASDPNTPPKALAYAWSASGGTITPDSANPASATWLAPATAGTYELRATVSNGDATSVSTVAVTAELAAYQGGLPVALVAPRRIAESGSGGMFVVDGDPGAAGRVALLNPAGALRGFATLPEPALALAYGGGFLWVTTTKGSLYKVDTATGRVAGKVALAGGAFLRPAGIAFDATRSVLWVADTDAGRVRVIRPDGTTVAVVAAAGGAPLAAPLDVAIDGTAGRAWLLVGAAKKTLAAGEPAAAGAFVHAFDVASRQYIASAVTNGTGAGQLTRAGGLAVSGGKVYVSDIFQGTVQVLGSGGSLLGTVGTFGQSPGQLMNPMGLARLANGDLAVANASLGRIDRFGDGTPLPSCAAGTACWSLPAWRPIAQTPGTGGGHGRGRGDDDEDEDEGHPGRHRRRGHGGVREDGGSDGAGSAPTVAVTGPSRTGPGLVRLQAVAAGSGSCALAWSQVRGPAVSLSSSGTASPSFVARTPATYAFDVVATCGGAASAPTRVAVTVENRPPRADAGRVIVVRPWAPFRLDASFSSDANGDPLAFSWDQTLGTPLVGGADGVALAARSQGAGLQTFQLTVTDGRGGTASTNVPVLVASGATPTAVPVARPAEVAVGGTVVLDATGSSAGDVAAYTWSSPAGPADVRIEDAGGGLASFVPPAAGHYRFQLTVSRGRLRSPPAEVDVYVSEAGRPLPVVAVTAPPDVVQVGAPVSLDASGTGSSLQYAWRQVSGPAAGLTSDDAPSATVVPFAPGFHVFEVVVREGAAESRPARVAFEARAGEKAIPRARAVAPRTRVSVGELVLLDGRRSSGASHHRWTQVAGPWVVLGGEGGAAYFTPAAPGKYAFELEVDDGRTRSAPARVLVEATEGEE